MKNLLGTVALFLLPVVVFSQLEQSKAIAETMASTFNIHIDKTIGTCFMVIKDGKQYFVTAAHLFQSSRKPGDLVPIQLVVQNEWQSFDARVYFHPDRKVDIAVFRLSEQVSQRIELPEELMKYGEVLQKVFQGTGISLDSTLIAFGMEIFFYGFPLGNLGTEAFGIKFPLIKKAIISGWVKYNGFNVLALDGHNNVGFSGGPVVLYNQSSKKMCVVGVVSGYVPEPVDIQHKGEILSFNENSGIIICYGKNYIEDVFTRYKKDLR